jgi:hypothetical protein
MNFTHIKSTDVNNEDKEIMFKMYEESYTIGNQPLWFKTKEELFSKYPCFTSIDNQYLISYVMFQFKNNYNKISLVCHNGTVEGKNLSIELRHNLLIQPGWILEASDKVSWILRSKKQTPIIYNYIDIIHALDIEENNQEYKIEMNINFNPKIKYSYQYTRVHYNKRKGQI